MTAPLQTRVGDMEELGTEIFSHNGVVFIKNSNREDDSHCNGTLSIIQYSYGKSIEWKPAEVSVVSDCQEQEWAIVNTVGRRSHSLSGSGEILTWRHAVQIPMCRLDSYKVHKRSRHLMLMQRDGTCHTFLFQFGNADTFVHALRAIVKTRRSRRDRHRYIVIEERAESASLNRSFAELNLFNENPTDVVWKFMNNLKHRPYETTLQTFSKLSDVLLYRGLEEQRPVDVAELLTRSLSSTVEVGAEVEGGYQVVGVLPPRSPAPRGSPLTIEQWSNAMDTSGRVVEVSVVKELIFRGGVSPSLRYEVWKFLLGYYPWNSTTAERQAIRKLKVEEYYQMKLQWRTITPRQEERFSGFRDRKSLIEKDVNRTDRTIPYFAGDNNPNLVLLSDILMTYLMYNFDLGYVQGMSDLLSPILTLMSNEVDAFWCFVGFMERVCSNFEMDQAGMKKQLSQLYSLLSSADHELGSYLEAHESANMFFCFRWLLVLFKREFSHQQIMNLWEVLWTDLPCPNFHLLICVAILDTEKTVLIESSYGFTEILKHVNDLSLRMDLQMLLSKAESIYRQLAGSQQLSEATKRVIGLVSDRSGSTNSSDDESVDPDKLSDHESISCSPTSPDEDAFETSVNLNYL